MENRANFLSRFRFERRRSRPALKILVIVCILFSILAVVAMSWARVTVENHTEALRTEAARLEQENSEMENRIDNMDAIQTVREIAREVFGLVDPGTIVIETE